MFVCSSCIFDATLILGPNLSHKFIWKLANLSTLKPGKKLLTCNISSQTIIFLDSNYNFEKLISNLMTNKNTLFRLSRLGTRVQVVLPLGLLLAPLSNGKLCNSFDNNVHHLRAHLHNNKSPPEDAPTRPPFTFSTHNNKPNSKLKLASRPLVAIILQVWQKHLVG